MKRYITEFIGTFFLVLSIGLGVRYAGVLAPLAIGSALTVMVYMGGHISGAHYNPAVTLAARFVGKISNGDMIAYWTVQMFAAIVATFVVKFLTGATFAPAPGDNFTISQAMVAEVIFTFALVIVILNVAVAKKTQGNSYYGMAIGFTVMAGAFCVGGISGGAFNPAVGVGTTIVHAMTGGGSWSYLWLYLVGPCIGASLAAMTFGMQESESA